MGHRASQHPNPTIDRPADEAELAWSAVQRYAAAKSRADIDGALTECSPGFELYTVAFGTTSQGLDAARSDLGVWFQAFPDYSVTTVGHLASAEAVACWGTVRATMAGDLGPFRATGQRYELAFACVFAIDDRRIAREEFHFDLAEMVAHLGLNLDEVVGALGHRRPAA